MLLIFSWLLRKNLRSALLNASGMIAVGVLGGLLCGRHDHLHYGIGDSGPGFNFPELVGLDVMIPDLLNAFSMGLSVNINDVWWLDPDLWTFDRVGYLSGIPLQSQHWQWWLAAGSDSDRPVAVLK